MRKHKTSQSSKKVEPFAVVYAYVNSTRPYRGNSYEALFLHVPHQNRSPYETVGRRELPRGVSRALDQLSIGQLQRIITLAQQRREQQKEVLSRRGMREEMLRQFPNIL